MDVLNVIVTAVFGLYLLFDAVIPGLAMLFTLCWWLARLGVAGLQRCLWCHRVLDPPTVEVATHPTSKENPCQEPK